MATRKGASRSQTSPVDPPDRRVQGVDLVEVQPQQEAGGAVVARPRSTSSSRSGIAASRGWASAASLVLASLSILSPCSIVVERWRPGRAAIPPTGRRASTVREGVRRPSRSR